MGNTCAQDCAALNYNRSNEATFDMNAEHSVPQYEKVKVLTSQAKATDLPRLGLGAQSQEPLSKRSHSASEDQQGGTAKVSFGDREQFSPTEDFPLQPTLPVDKPPSKESVQPVSTPVDDHHDSVANSVQEEQRKEEVNQESRKDLVENLEGEEEEVHVKSPVKEQEVEPVVQPVKQNFEASGTADFGEEASSKSPALELVFDVNGEKKIIQLHRRPLGAEFKKRMKGLTKIDKIRPHSYASELGMKVGWAIQSIGGEDVSKKSYEEVQVALKNGMMVLPFTLDAQ